ncbi:MAG: MFS transporter [Bryobacterales bacterium]
MADLFRRRAWFRVRHLRVADAAVDRVRLPLELAGAAPGSPEFNSWVGQLFYLPAVAGGIFGLLGGYLTDVLGRRRVLVWSILLYAFSAMAAGYATSPGWLLLFRCTTFIGVSVEFVAAVAWLAELFPDPKQRESVLGYTQAFSSIGGLLVTGAYAASVHLPSLCPRSKAGMRLGATR